MNLQRFAVIGSTPDNGTPPERCQDPYVACVAVVVPLFNRLSLTQRFCKSFLEVQGEYHTLVFVDDGSTDGTSEWLRRELPNAVVLRGDGDLWWTGGTNLGVLYALENAFDFVLTINNDAIVSPNFLSSLLQTAQANQRSIVGCRLHDASHRDRIWALGGSVRWLYGQPFHIHKPDRLESAERIVEVAILPGCGVLVPIRCFREIGLYDERHYPHYHADSEFTFRAGRAGYKILVDTQAIVWYDTDHAYKACSMWSSLFGKRSPTYWKPILAFHFAYCPWYLIAPSILQFYMCQNRFVGFVNRPKVTSEAS